MFKLLFVVLAVLAVASAQYLYPSVSFRSSVYPSVYSGVYPGVYSSVYPNGYSYGYSYGPQYYRR